MTPETDRFFGSGPVRHYPRRFMDPPAQPEQYRPTMELPTPARMAEARRKPRKPETLSLRPAVVKLPAIRARRVRPPSRRVIGVRDYGVTSCEFCGATFARNSRTHTYCGAPECMEQARLRYQAERLERQREQRAATTEERAALRAECQHPASRKSSNGRRECTACGKRFTPAVFADCTVCGDRYHQTRTSQRACLRPECKRITRIAWRHRKRVEFQEAA